ncbi:ferritin-like domain-containing protein [Rhodocytophaga rosea]|uniref:Ferritin-like domain-containing protein n=1 Tax=Rhodocytophaga rosea TaxID=2704465 RepID=A0A6C0GPC3_9BACT|nr:ferritin-like domain-containing protein [Rhodocytophaga rosea]QHT69432.1 ferritin-like domain-containing protein [Rhodocytophaga rosea]
MNILKILENIEKFDADVYDRLNSRRNAFASAGKFGVKVALASLPLALGSMFKKAYGQSSTSILDVLNFALTLEYLEDEFYKAGLASPTAIPADVKAVFTQIGKHETAHVNLLKGAITGAGGTPVNKPTFDFTAGGAFADVLTNPMTFMAVAQAFEDTGVRAYKGQAGNLISNNTVLTTALQIHSVEARHAAEVRRLRGQKGWITGNDRGNMPAATQAVYNGEENVKQGAVNDVKTITSAPVSAITEGFDEPLSKDEVLAIAGLFIVG